MSPTFPTISYFSLIHVLGIGGEVSHTRDGPWSRNSVHVYVKVYSRSASYHRYLTIRSMVRDLIHQTNAIQIIYVSNDDEYDTDDNDNDNNEDDDDGSGNGNG